MSTRSMIGVVGEDRKVRAVYCHSDGYPAGVGKTLNDHYKDWNKISKLIELGDLSCLGAEIGEKHSFEQRGELDVCTFYSRDRGETGVDATEYDSILDFSEKMSDSWCEWAYLWTLGGWWCTELESNAGTKSANKWASLALWHSYYEVLKKDIPEDKVITAAELQALIENGGELQPETAATLD